jgi:hypothetical protein
MCLEWLFSRKKPLYREFDKLFACSCDVCGRNFSNMEELIVHMGAHDTGDINRRLISGYGTVRCNRCWKSFDTVADMSEHACVHSTSAIQGLSPIASSGSLESVVIHE